MAREITLPNPANASAGETIQFRCNNASSWRTEPSIIPGFFDPATGTYTAPMPITDASQFVVIAKEAAGELGRSVVTVLPTQLMVQPARIESGPKQSVQFTLEPAALTPTARWSSSDEESKVNPTGVLTTPESIPSPKTIVVTASWASADGTHTLHGSASVKLSDPVYKFRAAFIATYVIVFAIGLFITLGALIVQDCLAGRKSALYVAPPAVTLRTNDTQQFQVRLACASNVSSC